MAVVDVKKRIIKNLEKIEDSDFLESLEFIVREQITLEISPEIKNLLEISEEQIQSGKTISHEDAMKRIKDKYGF